jgi:hypothetical protein
VDKNWNEGLSFIRRLPELESGPRIGGLLSHGEFIASKYIKLVLYPLILELFDFRLEKLRAAVNSEKERWFTSTR